MTQIAQYFAKAGISVDLAQLKKVDRYLALLEKKMRAFQTKAQKTNGVFNINFKFNTNRLQFDVQRAFLDVSRRVKFPIENFVVNKNTLSNQISTAIRQAVNSANKNINLTPRVSTQARGVGGGSRARDLLPAGIGGGLAGRIGLPALTGLGAVYGLNRLNRANQELVSTEIASKSIFGERGTEAMNWLKSQAEYTGFNYLETAPIFTSFMASSMPLMGFEGGLDVFKALTQFGRTRGTDEVGMKRAMTAIQQMASKGQVMSEELKLQLSEAKGFGESRAIFAEAYQESIGGNLQGDEAAAALLKAMEGGKVKSKDILPIVARMMQERAAGGIEMARKASTAEQARAANRMTDLLRTFSQFGGESGFARIFRTFNQSLEQSNGFIRSLAIGFDNLTKAGRDFLLIPQSIQRMFEGKDSRFGDWIRSQGEQGEKLIIFMQQISTALGGMTDLVGKATEGWKMLFSVMNEEGILSGLMDRLNNVLWFINSILKAVQAATNQDWGGVANALKDAGSAAILTSPSSAFLSPSVIESMEQRREAAFGQFDPAIQNVFNRQQRIDRFNAEGTPLGVLPMTADEKAARLAASAPKVAPSFVFSGSIHNSFTGSEFAGMNDSEMMDSLANKLVHKIEENIFGPALLMYNVNQ